VTFRIFAEDSIVPTTRRINLRGYLDTSGPHLITFGIRSVAASVQGGFCGMKVNYETPNGQLRTITLPAPADCATIVDSVGAMWYAPMVLVIDQRYPLGNGPQPTEPYGLFDLQFNWDGTTYDTQRISYECIVHTYDGSSTVVNIP
jgi:hypothetical protein